MVKGNICRKIAHRPKSEGQFFKSSQIFLSCITKIPKLKKVCNKLFEKLLVTVHELTQAFDMLHQNITIIPFYAEWVPCSRTTGVMGGHGYIVCCRDWMCDLLVYNMIWPSGLHCAACVSPRQHYGRTWKNTPEQSTSDTLSSNPHYRGIFHLKTKCTTGPPGAISRAS